MGSKYIKGEHNQLTIQEQIAALNKGTTARYGGKNRNLKAAFGSAKKKASTNRTGSQRGS